MSLSLSPAAARALIATIAASGVLLGVALAGLTAQALGGQDVPPEVLNAVAISTASGTCLMAGLVSVVVNLVAPRETTLATLLDLLPVPRAAAALGAHLPTMAVGAAGGAVLAIPTLWLAWRSTRDAGLVAVLCLGLMLCAAALNVLVCTVFAVVRRAAERWLRLPPHIALAVAGGTLIAVNLAAFGPTVLTDGMRPDAHVAAALWVTPQGLIAAGIRGTWWQRLAGVGGLAMWCVAAVGLFVSYFSGRLERAAAPARRLRVLAAFPVPRARWAGLVYIDVLTILRAPQFLVTVLLVPGGAVAARVASEYGLPPEVTSALAGVLLVAGMVLVGQSTGVALPYRWVVRAAVGPGSAWVAVKATAAAIVHTLIAAVAVLSLYVAGVPVGEDWSGAVGSVVLAWGSALLGGALAPYDDRHSLSPGVTLATSALLYALSSLTLDALPVPQGSLLVAVTCSVAAVFVMAYVSACRRLSEREPARA